MRTPKAPDPEDTAAAQSAANRDTAQSQQMLNMVNQVTPDGSLTYNRTGTNSYVDSLTGKTVEIPQFTATQALSGQNQQIYDASKAAELNIANIAKDQSGRIGSLLGTPLDLNNEAVEGRLMELGSKRLDPRFAREEEALRTRLANQGIQEGSAAYDAAYNNFSQGKNDAYNQLLLTGRGQAVQEALTARNQPINEITALMSGSQVSMPQFTSTPQTGVGGVDYTGLVNQEYQAKLQRSNAMMGGLFGTIGAGLTAFSDRRLKDDIRRVGTLDNGLPVYAYRMKGEAQTQIGLMADEVAAVKPEAVHMHDSGYAKVDYSQAVEA